MRTLVNGTTWTLSTIWLVSFTLCVAAVVQARPDIPDLFTEALRQVFDTFAPPLGAALGFIFSRQPHDPDEAGPGNKKRKKVFTSRVMVHVFALAVTLVYCGLFDYMMVRFVFRYSNIESVISGFEQLRPYISFMVAGTIGYYFGREQQALG
jgi:hypothetical protein